MRTMRSMIWATMFFIGFSTSVAKGQSESETTTSPDPKTVQGQPTTPRTPLTRKERAQRFVKGAFGAGALARAAAVGGINQERDNPAEWHQGFGGYMRRFSSSYGQHVVKESITYGVGSLHHEDPRHYQSEEKGFWSRTKYAVKSTFIVPSDEGGNTLAAGRLSGDFGAGLVSRAWWPTTAGFVTSGLESGGISLGMDVAANVVREFWPDIHKKFHHHTQ